MPKTPKERKQEKSFKCPECGVSLDLLTHVHIAKHGMTKEQFLKKYPELSSESYWGTAPLKINEDYNRERREKMRRREVERKCR